MKVQPWFPLPCHSHDAMSTDPRGVRLSAPPLWARPARPMSKSGAETLWGGKPRAHISASKKVTAASYDDKCVVLYLVCNCSRAAVMYLDEILLIGY